jgi:hypothetical protein
MEENIVEYVLGILMLYGFVHKAELQQGKFTKIIGVTFVSILFSARSDIQYFIANYPQRAIGIFFAGMIIIFIYARHSNILKKIKKTKKLNKMTLLIYFNKLLDWLYPPETDKYIKIIENLSLSKWLNYFLLLCLSILCFGHYPLKSFSLSSIIILFSIMLLSFLLWFDREITKHPFGMFIGSILMLWITFFFAYFSKGIGIKPLSLVYEYFVSSLGMNTSDLLGATIKLSIFSSAFLFFGLILFTISSMSTIFILKKIIETLIFLLDKTSVFDRQKRKAEKREKRKLDN